MVGLLIFLFLVISRGLEQAEIQGCSVWLQNDTIHATALGLNPCPRGSHRVVPPPPPTCLAEGILRGSASQKTVW